MKNMFLVRKAKDSVRKQWPCPQEPRVSPDGRAAGGQRQGNEAAAEGLLGFAS